MPGFYQVTSSLQGRYIELRSKSSGRVWKGKVKKVTIRDSQKEPARRILFDDGREVIAHENFSFTARSLD